MPVHPSAGREVARRAAAIVVAAVLVQALLVALFVLPNHDPTPHEVPVAVAGPPEVAQQIEQRAGDALEVVPVRDAAAAREAVLDREAYGALIPQEQRLLVASAASPAVAQLLQRTFADASPRVQELRPLDPDDPRGAALNLLMLPLIVAAIPLALVLSHLPTTGLGLAGVTLAFSALAGLTVTAVVHGWIGALPGSYLALAGVAALLVGAVALFATGLARALGPAGTGLAAVLVFLLGNPASGAASAPELLPGFWRAVGPLLPPGAGATALRNTAYFDGAALAGPLLVLGAFAAVGAALMLVPRRARISAAAPATTLAAPRPTPAPGR
jgi:hypothetical protein